MCVCVELCGVKAASILYLPWIGCKSPSGAMASLSCGGPLKCLRIMGKKATAWRMNQSIEPVLSLTPPPSLSLSYLFTSLFFLSPSLFLSLSLALPIFSSFASRSVLSWNIYSSPGPASLNRHTNSPLNIARCSLHAFPSVSSPQTQRSAIHTRSSRSSRPPARAYYRML